MPETVAMRPYSGLPRFTYFMARYEHLPIYKQAIGVAVYFERAVAGFSRYHNYTCR